MKALSLALVSSGFLLVWRVAGDGTGTANIGERFFLESRFSQFFFTNSGGNANYVVTNGDPVMATTETRYGPLPGPYAGRAMNCRACHLVQEHDYFGNRTYNDFAQRSPVPNIGDGQTHTARNSMGLVNSLLPHSTPLFLHHDGQFASVQDLIITTFTGRNFGWRPTEYDAAVEHIGRIVREDNGSGILAQQYGGWTYAQALAGGSDIQDQYRIAPAYRLFNVGITNPADPNFVSDGQILVAMSALIQAYLETLVFSQDLDGLFDGSPYDVFLIKNGLPREPASNETPLQYSRRLLHLLNNLANPRYVTDPADGHFGTHSQTFQFGPTELAGLKIFLTEGKSQPGVLGNAGNCIACHSPPAFTDFLFHNTGTAQEEYDSLHGMGSFMALSVPGHTERLANYNAYLPASTNHPTATGRFASPPTLSVPGQIDLGLWNVFANPDIPSPQPAIQEILPLLVPTPAPTIQTATRFGNNFVFNGTGGAPGWPYYVMTTTEVSDTPGWTPIATNTFGAQGQFGVTNPILSDAGFYKIAVAPLTPELVLPRTIGLFKTPDLRDLASSDPYFHTGRMNTLQEVLSFYMSFSGLARLGLVRNVDPHIAAVSLDNSALAPLVAFLRSLSEDYTDIPCPCR
jgi:hypothetical protein